MAQTDLKSLAELGTPAEIWAELMDFTLSAQRLSEPTQRLIDEYPQQWVAIYDGQVASAANSFKGVLSAIDARNIPRDKVIVRYIDTEPRTMIL